MVNRCVRWNMFTNKGEQIRSRHRYTFAVINQPREIDGITEKLIQQMAVVDEFEVIYDGSVLGSNGLHCRVFAFSSDMGMIQRPSEIYDNPKQFRRDRDLYERHGKHILPYVERLVASMS